MFRFPHENSLFQFTEITINLPCTCIKAADSISPSFPCLFSKKTWGCLDSLQKFKWVSLDCHEWRYSILSRSIQAKYFAMTFKVHGNTKSPFVLFWKWKLKCIGRARLHNRCQRTAVHPWTSTQGVSSLPWQVTHPGKGQPRESRHSSNQGAVELGTGNTGCLETLHWIWNCKAQPYWHLCYDVFKL